jgi:hypothetical protein
MAGLPKGSRIYADGRILPPSDPLKRGIDQPQATGLGATPEETFLNTFRPPQSRDQIMDQRLRASQAQIDSINKVYDDEVARKRQIGDERVSIDNAVSVLSGLMGSADAAQTRKRTLEGNEKEIQAVNNPNSSRRSRQPLTLRHGSSLRTRHAMRSRS